VPWVEGVHGEGEGVEGGGGREGVLGGEVEASWLAARLRRLGKGMSLAGSP